LAIDSDFADKAVVPSNPSPAAPFRKFRRPWWVLLYEQWPLSDIDFMHEDLKFYCNIQFWQNVHSYKK
jgi:hypothetical protein